ncbi:MAG: hypothetical protein V2A73_00235 [Pseudomonadota bacterium]
MNQSEFEQRLIRLWTTSRISLTRANLLLLTGVPRKKMERWLDELAAAGVIDPVEEEGDLAFHVRGASRPNTGPCTVAEIEAAGTRKDDRSLALASSDALACIRQAQSLARQSLLSNSPATTGRKSVLASGVLSFFLGPLGWLYAAPWTEAVVAIVIYLLAHRIVPSFLLAPMMGILALASGAAGAAYAWKFNANGKRTSLFSGESRLLPPKG